MGVYNPMAKMPDNCAVCKEECGHRNITAHKRHKRCPLIEVKAPHGRMIDVTEVIPKIRDSESAVLLSKASTVIEAEVE